MKIKARVGKTGKPLEVNCNIPATLAEKVKLFSEAVVNSAAEDSLIITVQALMRRMMQPKLDKTGKQTKAASTPAEIQAAVDAWRPDVRSVVRQSAFEKAASSISGLSPEERSKLLVQLQQLNAGAAKK